MKRLIVSLGVVVLTLVGVVCVKINVDHKIDRTTEIIKEIQAADGGDLQALSERLQTQWSRSQAMFYAWYAHSDVENAQEQILMIQYYAHKGERDALEEAVIHALMYLQNMKRSENLLPENIF